jgi:hypothetical protein
MPSLHVPIAVRSNARPRLRGGDPANILLWTSVP